MSRFVEYTVPEWRNLNMRNLKVDEAYLVPTSALENPVHLYMLSEECYSCPFDRLEAIYKNSTVQIKVAQTLHFKVFHEDVGKYAFPNESALCEISKPMEEFGVYNFTIDARGQCDIITDKEGVNVNISMLSVFLLFTVFLSVIRFAWCIWKSYHYVVPETVDASENRNLEEPKRRMNSLDAFRGLAIILMIFVNSGGGGYWWIEHAAWNGLHVADIVFPSFLWIMGVCIPISVRSQLNGGSSKWLIIRRITWRSVKLFLIGLCLNSTNGPQLENLRIMGVLQRFAIAFLVCGVLHTLFNKKEILLPQNPWKRRFFDLISFRGEYFTLLALIAINLGIIFGYNTPDCPKGYLGPGGKHAYAAYPHCIGGAAGYIDKMILGNNIYQHPTAKYIYDSSAFDPEGIFGNGPNIIFFIRLQFRIITSGCILTVVQVFYGVLCGIQILIYPSFKDRLQRWILWSIGLALIGGILCGFSKETGPIPLNKNLWSLSYVFVTTSMAFAILSTLYWFIDVRRWYNGFPFVESGKNAIIMYVGHTIMHKMLPWHWKIGAMNTHFILLLEATWNTLVWIGIALYLNSIGFYYSV